MPSWPGDRGEHQHHRHDEPRAWPRVKHWEEHGSISQVLLPRKCELSLVSRKPRETQGEGPSTEQRRARGWKKGKVSLTARDWRRRKRHGHKAHVPGGESQPERKRRCFGSVGKSEHDPQTEQWGCIYTDFLNQRTGRCCCRTVSVVGKITLVSSGRGVPCTHIASK